MEGDTMETMFRTCLGVGIFTVLVGPAMAANGDGAFLVLLRNASVQEHLKLDGKQVQKAKELAEKMAEKARENREALQGLEGEERLRKQQDLTREIHEATTKAIGEFLKPDQIARLKQISYQRRGIQAFSDPEVAKKLNITDEQKTAFRQIAQEARQERPAGKDFLDDREAAMNKDSEIKKEALAKAEAKLNKDQKKTWEELLGAPFEIKWLPRNR
jgi:hypothetical protein